MSRCLLVLTMGAISLAGCRQSPSDSPPTVHSVKGVVTKGGRPIVGGVIEFRSQTDQTLTMLSPIGEDGSFELYTIFRNEKLPGALAGPAK